MFYSRFPLLPLGVGRPVELVGEPVAVAGANGAAGPRRRPRRSTDAERAKNAAYARARRARQRAARQSGRPVEAPPDPDPAVTPEPDPAPGQRVCERCGAAPVAGHTARFCAACRSIARAEALRSQRPRPRPEQHVWPPEVQRMTDRLAALEDAAELADPDALPPIRQQVRVLTGRLEAAKAATMASEAPA